MTPTQEQQYVIAAALEGKDLCIQARAGCGKEQPVSCIVKTPKGDKRIGELVVGDEIFGADGEITKVIGVFPQGIKDVYEVTFRDKSKTRCGIDHNWEVTTSGMKNKGATKTMTLQEIIDYGIKYENPTGDTYKVKIPLCKPVNYSTKDLELDPYVLGAFLGDGTFTDSTPAFSYHEQDTFIFSKVRERLATQGIHVRDASRKTSNKGMQSTLVENPNNVLAKGNKVSCILKKLNLHSNKHIPEHYFYGDINQRLDLLQGLMDTDGSVQKNRVTFTNTNLDLINGLRRLVQSLGGTAILGNHVRKKDGRSSPVYTLNVKMFFNPFSLPRKANGWGFSKKNPPSRYITDIKKLDYKEEQVCIKVEAADSLYLTDDYIVTHNTSSLVLLANAIIKPSLYLAYNKAMAEEAKEKFPSHVEVRTTHSLAYAYVGNQYRHKLERPRGKYINIAATGGEVGKFFKIKPITLSKDKELSVAAIGLAIKSTVDSFEYSADTEIKDKHIPNWLIKDFKKRKGFAEAPFRKLVLKYAKMLWEERIDLSSIVKINHDTYMKLFQLSKPKLEGFEVIYGDEFQDVNACFLSIFCNQDAQLIAVGDSYQSIYQWRGSVDALEQLEFEELQLTKSFRFGQAIADVATKVLRDKHTGECIAQLTGMETIESTVTLDDLSSEYPYTMLFRTNATLLAQAVTFIKDGVKLNIEIRHICFDV